MCAQILAADTNPKRERALHETQFGEASLVERPPSLALRVSSVLILAERPNWRTAALLGLAIWCSARFYYFTFYVIQHYVDDRFRFSGLSSFVKYLFRKRNPPFVD